jgi:arylsulfatase
MRPGYLISCLVATIGLGPDASAADEGQRPNILLIVADDLAITDLGYMGSEIRTPNLDALARRGVILDNFYVSPACSPTRAMLMSGVDNHRSGLGVMGESIMPEQRGRPGYEGYLNFKVHPLAERMRKAGYATFMAGKWHLGAGEGQRPSDRGFDRSFALMEGGASHFSDARGTSIHSLQVRYFDNGRQIKLPPDFYSSAFYTDRLIADIETSLETRPSRPFFAYAAYTAPHWPLQVPDDWLDRYVGMYDDGYEALAAQRLKRQIGLGHMADTATPTPLPPHVRPWSALTPAQRRRESRAMEIYAAMVENLDHHIGRLIKRLKERGVYENTLVIFMADNGPEGNDVTLFPGHAEFLARSGIDDTQENMGRVGSYVHYGPGWATAAASPYRLYKAFAAEGGIRAPAFITWPARIAAGRRNAFTVVNDIAPTLAELAGPEAMDTPRELLRMDGISLVPMLRRPGEPVRASEPHGWELFNRRAIRSGPWKATWLLPPYGPGRWQLYHLRRDPYERDDLATKLPAKLRKMQRLWSEYARRNGVVELDYDMDYDK